MGGGPGGLISLERIAILVKQAQRNLLNARQAMGEAGKLLENIQVIHTDGKLGFGAGAPYHKISVACTAREVPESLTRQLAENGKMVLPVQVGRGIFGQELYCVEKNEGQVEETRLCSVAFVPLQDGIE